MSQKEISMEQQEKQDHIKKVLRNWVRALIVTTLIFALAVTITLYFKPLYYMDMKHYKLSETYGVSEEEIKANYNALISYNTLLFDDELEFPTLEMSEEGRIHFREVKSIFTNLQWAGLICLILLTPILTQAQYKKDYDWLKYAGGLCIGIPVIVGLLMLISWDNVFVWFHKLFFRNDYWMFDPNTDPIIQFLPDGFFLHCGLMIAALILLGAAGCLFGYHRAQIWIRSKRPSSVPQKKK